MPVLQKCNTLIFISLSRSWLTDSAGTLNQWGERFLSVIFKWMSFCIWLQFTEINGTCFRHHGREGKGLNELVKYCLVCDRAWWTSSEQVLEQKFAMKPNYIKLFFQPSSLFKFKLFGLDYIQWVQLVIFTSNASGLDKLLDKL